MLCEDCAAIALDFSSGKSETEIRVYRNIQQLHSVASSCNFCQLIYDEYRSLEDPQDNYCVSKWGRDLYFKALQSSPIKVYHTATGTEHNIRAECMIDAQNTPGYVEGPFRLCDVQRYGGICVEPDSPLASLVSGRCFEADASEVSMLALAKSWYVGCQTSHGACKNETRTFMPTRVIRLDLEDPSAKPHIWCIPGGINEAYVALSYCWGQNTSVLLTRHTIEKYSTKGIESLPRTIEDACELCRALGIRNLWVDRLCILQDSEEDWQQESSRMGELYSSAEFTIRAAAGQSCDAGLFTKRKWHSAQTVALRCLDVHHKKHECTIRGRMTDGRKESLDFRGWTLQEDVLSARVLSFGAVEMMWECRETFHNESGRLFNAVSSNGALFPRPLRSVMVDNESGPSEDDGERSDDVHHEIVKAWGMLVQDYSGRNLSVASDKLPALSGIAWWWAKNIALSRMDTYLAGLWKDQLPAGLLWYHNPPLHCNATAPASYRAPSWSWAALDLQYLEWAPYPKAEEVKAEVVGAAVENATHDPFGRVKSGCLTLRASLRKACLTPTRNYVERYSLCSEQDLPRTSESALPTASMLMGNAWLDLYEDSFESGTRRNLPIDPRQVDCVQITQTYGMLIERVGGLDGTSEAGKGEWKRIGLVRVDHHSVDQWWKESTEEVLSLV